MAKFVACLTVMVVLLALFDLGTALQCYTCDTACDVSKAQKRECGKNIGASHEAFCTMEFPKGKEGASNKVRRCQVVNKGQQPSCPQGEECKKCNTDLCNAAPSVGAGAAVAAILLARLFL